MSRATNRSERSPGVRVAIIGAGFGGLCTAIKLEMAGHHDFVVFERAEDVGGTWQANTYPGAACDAPSHIYSFSFAQDVEWSRRFAPGPEIQRYIRRCVERFGVGDRIRTGTAVTSAAWIDGEWVLELADESTHRADVLIPAVGQLSEPTVPEWAGSGRFAGPTFHTARWRHDIDLTDKRVAVVGTGASAVQVVPQITAVAAHLTVFQRSAPYVMRKPDAEYTSALHHVYRRAPFLKTAARLAIWQFFELFNFSFWRNPSRMDRVQRVFEGQLAKQVPDAQMRSRLTPDYRVGCKRIAISNDYYPALLAPHVDLVTDDVLGLDETGIVTRDGVIAVDAIVFATGFETSRFMSSVEIVGRHRSLTEAWTTDGAGAYLGLSVPDFPNMFLVYGPNTNLGAGSILYMMEKQADHVVAAVDLMSTGTATVEVTRDAHDAFVADTRAKQSRTIWAGCRNWYLDEHGRDTHNWHGSMRDYRRRTRRVGADAYPAAGTGSPVSPDAA